MKIYRCMHDIEAMCNEHGRQLLLIWFMNYLPLTKFHIENLCGPELLNRMEYIYENLQMHA